MTIRTPDDEKAVPYFYPPFKQGDTYQGITYPGHSDFAVDFNRRTPSGGWLPDDGEPVLAAANGTVVEVKEDEGYVLLDHVLGYRTEYRHMQPVRVKVGQKVQRGDRLGDIGEAGNAPNGTHLHMRMYKGGQPVQLRLNGKAVPVSVGNSDSQPAGWKPPAPYYVEGPPPKATWESAFREAEKALGKAEDKVAGLTTQLGAAREEAALARTAADELSASLLATKTDLEACRNATPPDCSVAVAQERDRVKAAAVAAVEAVQ